MTATSPLSPQEIEAALDARELPAPGMLAEWRRLGAFLRTPSLEAKHWGGSATQILGRIFALDMAVMFGLIVLASIVVAAGVELPQTALAGMEITWVIALAAIIAAPVMEEIAFRGWLTGKPGALIAVALLILVVVIALTIGQGNPAMLLVGIFAFVAALGALFFLYKRETPAWYTRAFPLFFWLAAVAFALVHIANFSEGAWWMLLPLVVPQLVLGALCGYVRVRLGLIAAIVLHMLHNATALSIALIGMNAAESAASAA